METNQQAVGKGLFLIFVGAIVSLFTGIPILGVIAAIVGIAISIYGLYKLSGYHPSYKNAFTVQIASIVVVVLEAIFYRSSVLGTILSLVSTVLGFLSVYFICMGTSSMLNGISTELMNRGQLIWKLYLLCTIILLVCKLLSLIPIINILAALIAAVTAIVQVVAGILYLIFIYKSYKALSA